jgi:hypothetical protein
MTRIIFKLISFFVLLLIITGCKKVSENKGFNETLKPPLLVEEARHWYSAIAKNRGLNNVAARSGSNTTGTNFEPLWDKAEYSEDENYYIVDCPLQFKQTPGYFISKPGDTAGENDINGLTRLLILKNKESGLIQAALMRVFSGNGRIPEGMSYAKRSDEFSGNIFFTDLDANFVNGWMYESGKIIKKSFGSWILPEEKVAPPSDDCYTYQVNWYEQTCYYYTDGSSECTAWEFIFSSYVTYCTGGGAGGYEEPEVNCDSISEVTSGSAVSEPAEAVLIQDDGETRIKKYDWIFHRNSFGLWAFHSHEKGVHKRVNGEWRWESLVHESISKTGVTIGATVDCILHKATPEVGIYNAIMALDYDIRYSFTCKGVPVNISQAYTTAHNFNVND